MTLSVQFITMLVMVLSGIYLGMAHDTFRRLSIHWKKKTIASYVLEISFWLVQTFIIFYCLFLVNAGEFRVYILLACLLGFSFYEAILKNGFKRILEGMIYVVRSIYLFFKQIIQALLITPIRWILLSCWNIVLFILNTLIKIAGFLLKVILLPFRLLGQLIRPLVPKKVIKFLHKLNSFYSTIRDTLKKP